MASEAPGVGKDLIGKVFAEKYEVDALLGEGGMGAVYRAHHSYLQHPVAIKLLHVDVKESDPGYKRFLREAQVLSRLDHRNAIRLHDFGFVDKTPYLIMEFVQGQTLRELLKEKGHLTPEACADILEAVCSALSEAHGKGIIHRDIKPDNVMITEPATPGGEKVVKVLDFGISKVLQPEDIELSETEITHTNMLMGTPKYIAPEQALGKPVDQRTDLYSLAVMTYEMLNGLPPFRGTTGPILLAQHLHEDPEPFDPKRKIKPALRQVILKALSKKPEDRQATIDQFLDEFRMALGGKHRPARKGEGHGILVLATIVLVGAFATAWVFNSGILDGNDKPTVVQDPVQTDPPASSPANRPSSVPDTQTGRPADTQGTGSVADTQTSRPADNPSVSDTHTNTSIPDTQSSRTVAGTQPSIADTQRSTQAPTQTSTAAPQTTPPAAMTSLPAKPPPGLYIELKRLPTVAEAEQLVGTLDDNGLPATFQFGGTGNDVFYEVLVGPFASIPEASSAGARIRQLPGIEGNVTRMRTIF